VSRNFTLGLLLALALAATGCTGGRDKGKNSDFDRPIPQKK
jgi:hypothetical protein